jgi:integrase
VCSIECVWESACFQVTGGANFVSPLRRGMGKKTISQNSIDSETNGPASTERAVAEVVNLDFFATTSAKPQSHIQALVKHIAREVNRHKLTYPQLKYIFRSVRQRCQVEVSGQRSRKLYELPSLDELAQFYGVIDDPVHKLIFEVLENTGLRISELCHLEVRRIDFKTNLIFVSEGKGKKDRVTVIGNKLLEKIKIYLDGRPNRYLFESNRHSRYSSRRIEQLCQEYRSMAGITKRLSPHTFRHVLFTRLAEAGVSKEKRMILAGHSCEKVQDQYTHLGVGGVKEDVIAILDKSR